ncbi:MAG: type I restriction endonuclease subunit R [archaeon]
MSNSFTESDIESLSIEQFTRQGFSHIPGAMLNPELPEKSNELSFLVSENSPSYGLSKRKDYTSVVLESVLINAIQRLNPLASAYAREQAFKAVVSIYSPSLIDANETFHSMLTEGVKVSIQKEGQERGERIWLIDFQHAENNGFHTVNQFTVVSTSPSHRGVIKRPDVILFVNGLPLVVMELKNPANERTSIRNAFDQIQTYQSVIPALFYYNTFCVISDGLEAKAGTISSPFSRYHAWKSPATTGSRESSVPVNPIETLISGMLNHATLLDLIRNFIVFQKEKHTDTKTGIIQIITVKKLAAYHQYYAVNKAVGSSRLAASMTGNRKAGVIWHTQGSGKSLSMVFYTGKLIRELDNPTIVVITDRTDLDDQLFDTFAGCSQLLGQTPVQANSRENLKSLLKVASGGIVFTTIQKFFPDNPAEDMPEYDRLSDRRNIFVIADEAHRTQYGFKAKVVNSNSTLENETEKNGVRITYGFAKYLRDAIPNATFIGFTGTPIENVDINTPAVFGNYIDIYDIAQSVEDGATLKIYYESRLAKVNITEEGRRLIAEFDASAESEMEGWSESQKAKAKWTKLEAIVGHPDRQKNLARDIVNHFEKRSEVLDGKAMIVVMSRRIAVDLYREIVALRPEWHSEDRKLGAIKIVMTSASSDKMEFDPEDPEGLVIPVCHRTNKDDRQLLSDRMKDPTDSLKMVIVCDMWLTGFDVPCLHTMYIDKLMKGHSLMQAIARVNRVFMDKPGGLIVDYIGIGDALKEALAFYSSSGGRGNPAEIQAKALDMLFEKIEVVRQMFYGLEYYRFFTSGTSEKLSIILQSEEHILSLENGKERYLRESAALSRLFAMSLPHDEALALKDEIAFFMAVRARLMKFSGGEGAEGKVNVESVIRQIVNQSVESSEVLDIFASAGVKKPEISLLSEEFLHEISEMKHRNLAFELMKKILNDEIRTRLKYNLTEGKSLLEMLESSIHKYQNNLLTTAEVIEELLKIARQIRTIDGLAEKLNLSKDEFAFYTALEVNDSAVKVLGDETLKSIAREIAAKVHRNATIDWTMKESARAKLMVIVKRTLNKFGYPPDKQQKAIDTVMKQAEVLADYWVENG